ncbi:alcohol oxidase [Hygrophoropsis aurantiaca]|uniref:Alcohol oxidase n=1 Tax=Hygrophoropsis aurantiaca TaxID=72124 RepID=A0ACB8AL16_9AGAM|nr:alcohol oxidase [Hygrophoropsis aurantiaca]
MSRPFSSIVLSKQMSSHNTMSPEAFTQIKFDYIIVGGGNAGLPIAARLSENPGVTVGLLEAGLFHGDNPLIDVPRPSELTLGNPTYDWGFSTTAQRHAGNREIYEPRGKMLGGSTGINFLAWDRASKEEYDAWKMLSDPVEGWDWASFMPYLKKAENSHINITTPDFVTSLSLPGKLVPAADPQVALGTEGSVKTSRDSLYTDIVPPYIETWNALGVSTNPTPFEGDASGLYGMRRSVDVETGKRSYATPAYYGPASQRKNFHVLTGAHATRITFNSDRNARGKLIATGVEYIVNDQKFVANAAREVILSAGAVQTPQLLELSGLGDEKRLRELGIQPLIHLPGVGENLQDHAYVPIQYPVNLGIKTFDELRNKTNFGVEQERLYETVKGGWLTTTDTTVVYLPFKDIVAEPATSTLIGKLEDAIGEETLPPLQEAQYKIQLDWLKKGGVPDFESLLFSHGVGKPDPHRNYFILLSGIQHPFSRGSVHITDKNPLKPPALDPNYLSSNFGKYIDCLVAGYRSLKKLADTAPFSEVIDTTAVPPEPFMGDDEVRGYIRQTLLPGYHLLGTAAMAREEMGGVVDHKLVVYGTSNLRIADASIIPIPIAAHLQATVYAIGEKAADLIKGDFRNIDA